MQTVRLFLSLLLLIPFSISQIPAQGYMQEGFGRFGRFNDDGLLTLNIFPDRAEVPGLTLRFAGASVTPTVTQIDTTAKTLALSGGGVGDAESVHYTLLYPGFTVNFGTEARFRLNRSTVIVENLNGGDTPVRRGFLLRASSGSMTPIAIAFPDGFDPGTPVINDLGSSMEIIFTSATDIGEVRVYTPAGNRSINSVASLAVINEYRSAALAWLQHGAPRMTDREVAVDLDANTVTITETFSRVTGDAIAPIPPVLAFAIQNGYPASVVGTIQRSGFPTRYGEFAWVEGDTLVYTLPIPPYEERGLIRPLGRTAEINLLNDMATRLGTSWAVNAVDLGYVGMTPAQKAWTSLSNAKRTTLENAWATYLPFAFRLPPYAPADTRKTWIEETEPLSGLDYIYTYFITGGPGNSYKLDVEWGNMLPIYGLAKYAQYSGDWTFVQSKWDVVKEITKFTDYADDWAWMTNANGDMGWSTGTGDPMTAATIGHIAALRMAIVLDDEDAIKHYAYRAARQVVPSVSRFWYTTWARNQGFINSNQIVQGFWEKSTFTATTMSQSVTDPWGPTNPLSGNGAQPEFFNALIKYAPAALQAHQDQMLVGYPNLFNPDYSYSISTTYGGNSVYVTFPHLYARAYLGQDLNQLWTWLNAAQSNRGTTSWIAPVVIAELLGKESPFYLTEWAPVRWREGYMQSPSRVLLTFETSTPREWTMTARLTTVTPIESVEINNVSVPFSVVGDELRITANVSGTYDVVVRFAGEVCPSEVVVDNESPTGFATVGSWPTSANPPLVGSNSYYAFGGSTPERTVTWTPFLECGGLYDVYATWVSAANRTETATYRITHLGGVTEVTRNHRTNGNQWNLLGQFEFVSGSSGNVLLTNAGVLTTEIVSADAVRFVYVGGSEARLDDWMLD